MRFILTLITMLVVTGCGSSSSVMAPTAIGEPQSFTASPGKVTLALVSSEQDGRYVIELEAREAQDLYQVAASIAFEPDRYQIKDVTAGGGLGEPEGTYFAYSLREPGQLDFGYTKRYRGPGISGNALLLRIEVEPLAGFDPGDFKLLTAEGQLVARDSLKHDLETSFAEGGQR